MCLNLAVDTKAFHHAVFSILIIRPHYVVQTATFATFSYYRVTNTTLKEERFE